MRVLHATLMPHLRCPAHVCALLQEEAERDFLRHHPLAHATPFADIPGLEDDVQADDKRKGRDLPGSDPMDSAASRARAAMEEEAQAEDGEATEAQARSKVCKRDGRWGGTRAKNDARRTA